MIQTASGAPVRSVEELLAWRPGDAPHMRVFSAPLQFERAQKVDDPEFTISGRASISGFMGDGILLEPSYMPNAVDEFMENNRMLQASHSMHIRDSIGRVLEMDVDEQGIFARSLISQAETAIRQKVLEEILRAYSLNFYSLPEAGAAEWDDDLGVVRLRKYRFQELSVVSLGADPGALFQSARQFQVRTKQDVHDLRALFVPEEKDPPKPECPGGDDVAKAARALARKRRVALAAAVGALASTRMRGAIDANRRLAN